MPKHALEPYILEPARECMPVRELRALQSESLVRGTRRAWEQVPLYRRKFEEAGVDPGEVRSIEDLPRLPFTHKTDLRDTYPFGMLAVPFERVVRIHASSGTTGKPTVVAYTRNDLELWAQMMARDAWGLPSFRSPAETRSASSCFCKISPARSSSARPATRCSSARRPPRKGSTSMTSRSRQAFSGRSRGAERCARKSKRGGEF